MFEGFYDVMYLYIAYPNLHGHFAKIVCSFECLMILDTRFTWFFGRIYRVI
jgi:hypothetical protein